MPELPEVETVVCGLRSRLYGRRIVDFWSDWPKYFRKSGGEKKFRKHVVGRKIVGMKRRGKNILIELSNSHLLLIHQKLSGHLLYGNWAKNKKLIQDSKNWDGQKWLPEPFKEPLVDPMNRFIRLIFFLDNKKMLVLSDLRRFAKVLYGSKDEIMNLADLKDLGPEPLEKDFSFAKFKALFNKKQGWIKQVLMDQNFIVGIGNIYADEILYDTKIHPLSRIEKLKEKELRRLYNSTRKILEKAVKLKGTSVDDFRDPSGVKGRYGQILKVYQKEGGECPKGHIIKRMKIGARSAHFCPKEQKLYK
jgi:formamidopyrimidine-DNA glycosylase